MIEYDVGAWLTLGIAFKKSNPSPTAILCDQKRNRTEKPGSLNGFRVFTSIFQWPAFLQPKGPRPGLCRSNSLPRQAVALGAVTQEPSPVSSVILQCHHGDVIKLRLLSHKGVNLLPDIVQKLFGFC